MISTKQLYTKIEKLPEKYQQHLSNYIDLLLKDILSEESKNKEKRTLGFLKGTEYFIADDFDEPLDDFKDYM